MPETIARPTGVVLVDWSNIWLGWEEMNYPPEEYDLESGFDRFDQWLAGICHVTLRALYAPKRDTINLFEFLDERGYDIHVCPGKVVCGKRIDTTDEKLIESAHQLIARYAMDYLFIGSGDHGFAQIMKSAKAKGIKTGIVYGSDVSLSPDLYHLADPHPEHRENPMLYLFAPTIDPPR